MGEEQLPGPDWVGDFHSDLLGEANGLSPGTRLQIVDVAHDYLLGWMNESRDRPKTASTPRCTLSGSRHWT